MEGKQSSATTRARGRGRGRGRGRAATTTSPIEAREAGWMERMEGLMEKAQELQDVGREDVAVAMVYSRTDEIGGRGYWPSMEEAREVVELFFALPKAERITEDRANYVTGLRDAQRSKLDKVREGGIAATLGLWECDLDGKPLEALQELFASIEVSQKAAQSRIRERQTHPDESVAENLVAGEKDASDEVQGTQKQPHGADEVQETQNLVAGEKDASDELLGTQKQPHGADEVQETQNLVAGEKDASDEVQGTQKQPHDADDVQDTQKQPHGADEVPGTQNQPPGDDEDDDAPAWMEWLVEDLKEKPESASGSAAPYRPAPHEYINVGGGHMMEGDAYDYMRFDMRMFTPYYGQPPRRWPWDDSSTAGGAPPPPPPPK